MKIRALIIKIAYCTVPLLFIIVSYYLTKDFEKNKNDSASLLNMITKLNFILTITYFFYSRNIFLNRNEKLRFLGKRIDLLFIINSISLAIVLILFYNKFWGIVSIMEAYMMMVLVLYGNYYSLIPRPQKFIFQYLDEKEWIEVRQLTGRLIFTFAVVGLLIIFYFTPQGMGVNIILLIFTIMAITFVITYFYAKQQYNRKFNH
jgi:lysylphosphatidylglycerol synthetase-like protein (DUF2156 family)